jgi:hypothetical protein
VIFVEAESEKKIEMSSRMAPSRKPSVAQMHGRAAQESSVRSYQTEERRLVRRAPTTAMRRLEGLGDEHHANKVH